MYGQYVLAVIRRAVHPTVRITDALQILAASAAPFIPKVTGWDMPGPNSVLEYVGAIAAGYVLLRLFFVAPYEVWREQVGELGALRLELSKPERMELARMAQIRAKKKIKLAAALHRLQSSAYLGDKLKRDAAIWGHYMDAVSLIGECGLGMVVTDAVDALYIDAVAVSDGAIKGDDSPHGFTILWSATDYIHGKITGEELARRLPQGTETRTPR